jgi:hypothetical protein
MAIKSPHKLIRFYLSPEEYKKLNQLAKDEGIFVSAYLRNLINTFYYLNYMDVEKVVKSGKLEFGGFGIEFSKEVMEDFIQRIGDTVKSVDWEKFASEVVIKPHNCTNSKVITKVKQRSKKGLKQLKTA